jgi:hypothetical protein
MFLSQISMPFLRLTATLRQKNPKPQKLRPNT